jgi:hypothetical protein
MHKFKAAIDIIIGNPFVYLPEKILQDIFKEFGKDKGPIPVKGKINGAPYTQTLMKYDGVWRLYINIIMLKAAGFKFPSTAGGINEVVGEKVDIEIEVDKESRELPMNETLKKALDKDKKASDAYNELSPSRKHEILRYLGFLKSEETIELNVGRILKHLRGEETDALYPLMHRKKKKE